MWGALAGVYEAQDTNRIINCKVYLEPEAEPGAALFDYRSYTVTGGAASTGGLIGLARKGKIQESFAAINVQGRGGAAGRPVRRYAECAGGRLLRKRTGERR